MINIFIKSGKLIVEDFTRSIFDWKSRSFFTLSLGFEIDDEKSSYYFESNNMYLELVNEVVEHLNELEFKYEVDSKVAEFIEILDQQKAEYQNVESVINENVEVNVTDQFIRTLKSYQYEGLKHHYRTVHAANFSVPGSGKTTMVYALFNVLKSQGVVDKIFVVGPFSSFMPWEDEGEKCFKQGIKSSRLVGAKRASKYLQTDSIDLFLCHYQTVANDKNDIISLLRQHKFLFVVDESHYIKRLNNGVWSDTLLELAPFAKRRIILSGTPMPNGLIDLWSQITFLWPGKQVLGDKNQYKNQCDEEDGKSNIIKKVRPIFFRIKKSDLQLPRAITNRYEYELKPIQKQIYHALSIKLLSDLNAQPTERLKLKQWRKAKMVRLIQAASNPTLLHQYSKEFDVPPLSSDGSSIIELIEKYPKYEVPSKFHAAKQLTQALLEQKKKVILWTTFIHNIEMLQKIFVEHETHTVHGLVPKDEFENDEYNREKEIKNFKESTNPCILIANPAACAESISLHKYCHDAIYIDRTFNCGQYLQSMDRIHRIGLDVDEFVNYHILVAKNTIDETIDKRLIEKEKDMLKVLEDEIPIGDFEVGESEMENDSELKDDFEETVRDVISQNQK